MTIRLSTGLRNNIVGSVGYAGSFEKGIIEIRTGPQPASADAAATGVLLGVVTLNSLPFTPGSPTNGLTFAPADGASVSKLGIWSFKGIAEGTAGWFRFKGNALDENQASTTLARMDGAVASSGADLDMHIAIKVNETGTIDNFTLSLAAQR